SMFRKSLPDFRGRNAGGWRANLSQKVSHPCWSRGMSFRILGCVSGLSLPNVTAGEHAPFSCKSAPLPLPNLELCTKSVKGSLVRLSHDGLARASNGVAQLQELPPYPAE